MNTLNTKLSYTGQSIAGSRQIIHAAVVFPSGQVQQQTVCGLGFVRGLHYPEYAAHVNCPECKKELGL